LTAGRNVSCSGSSELLNGGLMYRAGFSQAAPYTVLVLVVVVAVVVLLLCISKIKIRTGTHMFMSEIPVPKYPELKHLSNVHYLRLREITVQHSHCVNTGHSNLNCPTETLCNFKTEQVTNQNFCEYEVNFKARNQTNNWTNASFSTWQY
jgi:hypothetical protein